MTLRRESRRFVATVSSSIDVARVLDPPVAFSRSESSVLISGGVGREVGESFTVVEAVIVWASVEGARAVIKEEGPELFLSTSFARFLSDWPWWSPDCLRLCLGGIVTAPEAGESCLGTNILISGDAALSQPVQDNRRNMVERCSVQRAKLSGFSDCSSGPFSH